MTLIKGRLSLTAPVGGGGGGCVDHVDYLAGYGGAGAGTATVSVSAGETLVVTGTIGAPLLGGVTLFQIMIDDVTYGATNIGWQAGAGDAALTVTEVFEGLTAGDHTVGFIVDGVPVTDGPWAFQVLHCSSSCVYVHVALGG